MNDSEQNISTETKAAKPYSWRQSQWMLPLVCLPLSFFIQLMLQPVSYSSSAVSVTIVFHGLILIRILVALILKQRDKGWLFYTILMFVSTPLMQFIAWTVVTW